MPFSFIYIPSEQFKLPSSVFKGKEKVADARRKELAKDTKSDHLTVVNAFKVKWTYFKFKFLIYVIVIRNKLN